MKVVLIYPPITLHKFDRSTPAKFPLIGLGYIGAVLQKAGHTVKILDCLVSSSYSYSINSNFTRFGHSDEEIMDCIKSFHPDVAGISCMFTPYFRDAHNIARIVKEYSKDILVVFGGAHTSTFPEIVMKDNNIDVAVIGEGENTICELLDAYKGRKCLNGIRGIIHRVNGSIKREEPRGFIQDLDDVPFPAWELLENELKIIERENQNNRFLMRKPAGYILTSRGCPKDCYFCSVKLVWTRHWRARSAKNVVDEIEFLGNKYGYKEFLFVDDNCSVSKKRMYEICDEILKRGLDIKLATPTGIAIGTLDKDILTRMKKAGFYRLCFGIESGDPEAQKIIRKNIDLSKSKEIISQANKLGFWTSATFIIGFPHESLKTIRRTIEFTKVSNMDFAVFYLLTPQPKTEAYDILKQQGLVDLDSYIEPDSDKWFRVSITYCNGLKTIIFSNSELHGILSKAYKEFLMYKLFSFQTYINLMRKIKTVEDLIYAIGLLALPIRMIGRGIFRKSLSNVTVIKQDKELVQVEDILQ